MGKFRVVALLLGVLVGLVSTAVPSRASTWSHEPLAPSDSDDADAVMTTEGDLVFLWRETALSPDWQIPLYAKVRSPDGTWSSAEQLDTRVFEPDLDADGQGGAWAAWTDDESMWAAYRPPGGPFETPLWIGSGTGRAVLDVNAAGDVAVLYHRIENSNTQFLLSVKRAEEVAFTQHAVGPPAAGESGWWRHDVAVGADGTVLAAWVDANATLAAWKPPGGPMQTPQVLSSSEHGGGWPSVAVSQSGRGVAAWEGGEPYVGGGPVEVAVADPLGSFPAPQHLPATTGDFHPTVTTHPDGSVLVLFGYAAPIDSGGMTLGKILLFSLAPGAPTVGDAVSVSADATMDPLLVLDPSGQIAVAYLHYGSWELRIARAAADGGFGPPEAVTCPRPYGLPRAGAVGPDGKAWLLWRRVSRPPLPAWMLSTESGEGSPPPCDPIPPWPIVTPEVAPPGVERTLDFSGAVEPGEDFRIELDFDGDGTYESDTSQAVVRHTFPTKGRFKVGYMIWDTAGNGGGSSFDVLVTTPPSAELVLKPSPVRVGDSVTLDARGSRDPDGEIVRYEFADTYLGGPFAETDGVWGHSPFQHALPVRATVTVTDDVGATATAVRAFDVQPMVGYYGPPPQAQPQPELPRLFVSGRQRLGRLLRRGLRFAVWSPMNATAAIALKPRSATSARLGRWRRPVRAQTKSELHVRLSRAAQRRLAKRGTSRLVLSVRVGRVVLTRRLVVRR